MKVSKSIKFRGLALIALAVSTMVSASLVQALEVTEEISSAFEAGNEVTTSVNLTIERALTRDNRRPCHFISAKCRQGQYPFPLCDFPRTQIATALTTLQLSPSRNMYCRSPSNASFR